MSESNATAPQPMPAKAVLRRLEIPQKQVAWVAGRSGTQVSLALNGYVTDERIEAAIALLVGDAATLEELFGSAK